MANSSTGIKKAEKIISLTKEQERYCTELEKTSEGKKLAKEFKKAKAFSELFAKFPEVTAFIKSLYSALVILLGSFII